MPATNESAKCVNKECLFLCYEGSKRCVTLLQGKRDHFYSLGDVTDFSVKVGRNQGRIVKVLWWLFLNVFVFLKACYYSITLMHFGQEILVIYVCYIYNIVTYTLLSHLLNNTMMYLKQCCIKVSSVRSDQSNLID